MQINEITANINGKSAKIALKPLKFGLTIFKLKCINCIGIDTGID